jgi:hypothetical protein
MEISMEIKIAFATIVGLIMMITVIIAVIVMMGGLTQFSVSECVPIQYTASGTNFGGKYCGMIGSNKAYCDKTQDIFGTITGYDDCIDASKNLCCPNSTKQNIKLINGQCCNITRL